MTIPYTFAGATTAIPLAQLDANFASPITLGNVAMTLSNTYTSIGNLTLTNVTISSGTINSAITQTYGNANAVVFTNSSNVATTSTSLYFDGTNLGIGTTSPVAKLQVRGSGTSGQVTSSFILENFSSGTFGADITGSAGSSYLRFLYGGGPSTGTNTLTETMRIGLEGTSAGVQQIKFAATQSASGDANCLDDYEEGTWTPNQGAGLTVVGTFASSGSYTKVGRMV